ncbi:MAG: ABC transporter ATP-binding protein [Sinimarinibacterium flocculans]|uniref:ABC transporter ATP-binding protein n=1 Tax=Sinimarinibacterium flocculans TaxID=985250 RepID=UPI003C3FD588
MIRIKGVTKSYPLVGMARHTVIRDLTLDIPSRTHVGIVGRNGTGKTTLLRLLGGIELPDRGSVEADGSISPPLGLASGFAQKISGHDNAKFVCRISGDDAATARERIAFIRAFSELGGFFDLPVETYSSGMRARLAFSISMSFDYDYYLIDELTAVGDQKFRAKAQASFAQKRGSASVLMVSHNLDQLQRDCEVGIYLRAGRVTYYDDIGRAIADYKKDQHAS